MKKIRLASLLPFKILSFMAEKFDTPGAFELPELGSSFWMDAHYYKYVRNDKRKYPQRYGCCGECPDGEHLFICPLHPEPWRD